MSATKPEASASATAATATATAAAAPPVVKVAKPSGDAKPLRAPGTVSSTFLLEASLAETDAAEADTTPAPAAIAVTDVASLRRELTRLNALLNELSDKWKWREAALRRVYELSSLAIGINPPAPTAGASAAAAPVTPVRAVPDWAAEYLTAFSESGLRDSLALQLSDRRSAIVKEAGRAIAQVVQCIRDLVFPPLVPNNTSAAAGGSTAAGAAAGGGGGASDAKDTNSPAPRSPHTPNVRRSISAPNSPMAGVAPPNFSIPDTGAGSAATTAGPATGPSTAAGPLAAGSPVSPFAPAVSAAGEAAFVSMVVFFVECTFPIVVNTTKVISNPARVCFLSMLSNCSLLPFSSGNEYPILRTILSGTTHKHAIVRLRCFQGLALLLSKYSKAEPLSEAPKAAPPSTLPASIDTHTGADAASDPDAKTPTSGGVTPKGSRVGGKGKPTFASRKPTSAPFARTKPHPPTVTIVTRKNSADGNDATAAVTPTAAAAAAANATDSKSVTASTPTNGAAAAAAAAAPLTGNETIYVLIDRAIAAGVKDTDPEGRVAARECLIEFSRVAPARAQNLLWSLSSTAQKLYQTQLSDHIASTAIASADGATIAVGTGLVLDLSLVGGSPPKSKYSSPLKHRNNPFSKGAAAAAASASATALSAKLAISLPASSPTNGADANGGSGGVSPSNGSFMASQADGTGVPLVRVPSSGGGSGGVTPKNAITPNSAASDRVLADALAAVTPPDENARLAAVKRSADLLIKFLDLESPQLTDKMADFFTAEGITEALFGFVTRLPAGVTPAVLIDPESKEHKIGLELAPKIMECRPRGDSIEAEATATRRSFQVYAMICTRKVTGAMLNLLADKMGPILFHLLSVFHPLSGGNFYHTCALLTKMLRLFPDGVHAVLLSSAGSILFLNVFYHLHEPAVPSMLLDILASPTNNNAAKKLYLFQMLSKLNILQTVVARIAAPNACELVASASADFLITYIERAVTTDHMNLPFASICDANGFLDSLMHVVCAGGSTVHPIWQRQLCTKLLLTVLRSSVDREAPASDTPVFGGVASTRLVPNRLHVMSPIIRKRLLPYLPALHFAMIALSDYPIHPTAVRAVAAAAERAGKSSAAPAPATSGSTPAATSTASASTVDANTLNVDDLTLRSAVASESMIALALAVTRQTAAAVAAANPAVAPSKAAATNARRVVPFGTMTLRWSLLDLIVEIGVHPIVSVSQSPRPSPRLPAPVAGTAAVSALNLPPPHPGSSSASSGVDTKSDSKSDSKISPRTAAATALPALVMSTCGLIREYPLLPKEMWHVLADWFFAYPNNNFYLNPFHRLFVSVLRAPITHESTALLRYILTASSYDTNSAAPLTSPNSTTASTADTKSPPPIGLLHRMIEHLTATASPSTATAAGSNGARSRSTLTGFVIELCNHIRLSAAVQSHSLSQLQSSPRIVAPATASSPVTAAASEWSLAAYLTSSAEWQSFLPLLIEETVLQVHSAIAHPKPNARARAGSKSGGERGGGGERGSGGGTTSGAAARERESPPASPTSKPAASPKSGVALPPLKLGLITGAVASSSSSSASPSAPALSNGSGGLAEAVSSLHKKRPSLEIPPPTSPREAISILSPNSEAEAGRARSGSAPTSPNLGFAAVMSSEERRRLLLHEIELGSEYAERMGYKIVTAGDVSKRVGVSVPTPNVTVYHPAPLKATAVSVVNLPAPTKQPPPTPPKPASGK